MNLAHEPIPARLNALGTSIVEAATRVHMALGPGLLESVYKACLLEELGTSGLAVRPEVAVPIVYQNVKLEAGFRIDLLVEDSVIVEVKSLEAIHQVHQAQVLTYLQLSGLRLGYLLNFNVALMKEGIRRFVR